MITDISVGTETYGRVKTVAGTPIITEFVMFQFLPIRPKRSYYSLSTGRETSGVPFVAELSTAVIDGLPLNEIDWASVTMAYLRAALSTMILVGFLAIIPIIMVFTGEHLDAIAKGAMWSLIGCFTIGLVGGALTYCIPLTSARDRQIRSICAEVLGIAADPARVPADIAITIERFVADDLADQFSDRRFHLIQQLIACRARVAQGEDVATMERKTDRLVGELSQEF